MRTFGEILRDFYDGIKGEPLDPERPEDDMWVVVPTVAAVAVLAAMVVVS